MIKMFLCLACEHENNLAIDEKDPCFTCFTYDPPDSNFTPKQAEKAPEYIKKVEEL